MHGLRPQGHGLQPAGVRNHAGAWTPYAAAWRPGHDSPVFVHNIIARDTVDEMVMERVESKLEVQDILLAAMKRRRL